MKLQYRKMRVVAEEAKSATTDSAAKARATPDQKQYLRFFNHSSYLLIFPVEQQSTVFNLSTPTRPQHPPKSLIFQHYECPAPLEQCLLPRELETNDSQNEKGRKETIYMHQKQYPLLRMAIAIVGFVLAISMTAVAQEQIRSEISIQGTGFFTKGSSGRGIHQDTTDTGGVLGTYRYHLHSWLSAEVAYGWNRNTQLFSAPVGRSGIQADVHQATGGFVVSLPSRRFWLSPYALVEGGALVFKPTNNLFGSVPGAQPDAEGVFVYGVGADVASLVSRHIALRLEYRGLVYHAPNFALNQLNTDATTHTAEPSAGIVFRF